MTLTKTTFGELVRGNRFVFRGKSYVKVAMSMAHDENRLGDIFQAQMEVERIDPGDEQAAEPGPPEKPAHR